MKPVQGGRARAAAIVRARRRCVAEHQGHAVSSSTCNDLALIDAGGANLGSVRYALGRIGAQPRLVRDADELGAPERIILPRRRRRRTVDGAAARARADAVLRASEVPLLGVCVGMQLLFEASEER